MENYLKQNPKLKINTNQKSFGDLPETKTKKSIEKIKTLIEKIQKSNQDLLKQNESKKTNQKFIDWEKFKDLTKNMKVTISINL